jgi:hypothetical protein
VLTNNFPLSSRWVVFSNLFSPGRCSASGVSSSCPSTAATTLYSSPRSTTATTTVVDRQLARRRRTRRRLPPRDENGFEIFWFFENRFRFFPTGFSGNGIFQNRNRFSEFYAGIGIEIGTAFCRPFFPVTDFNRNFPNSSFGIFRKIAAQGPHFTLTFKAFDRWHTGSWQDLLYRKVSADSYLTGQYGTKTDALATAMMLPRARPSHVLCYMGLGEVGR